MTSSSPPARDLVKLVRQFRGIDVPRIAQSRPVNYAVGDVVSFWFKDMDEDKNKQIQAILAYRSEALNMWFQMGETVDDKTLREAASVIEQQILPASIFCT
jgi:hypothetical protein